MLIDIVAAHTLGRFKGKIKEQLEGMECVKAVRQYKLTNPDTIFATGPALLHLSEKLGTRHDAYSARDRVARGLVVNLVMICAAALLTKASVEEILGLTPQQLSTGAAAAAILAFLGWWQAESASQLYKYQSLATVLALRARAVSMQAAAEPSRSGTAQDGAK